MLLNKKSFTKIMKESKKENIGTGIIAGLCNYIGLNTTFFRYACLAYILLSSGLFTIIPFVFYCSLFFIMDDYDLEYDLKYQK